MKEGLSKYDLRMAHYRMSLITDSGLGSSLVIILYREALQLPPKLDTALATLHLLDPLDERETVEDLILRGEKSETYDAIRSTWSIMLRSGRSSDLQWKDASGSVTCFPYGALYSWAEKVEGSNFSPEQVGAFMRYHPMKRDLSPLLNPFHKAITRDGVPQERLSLAMETWECISQKREQLEQRAPNVALKDSSLGFVLDVMEDLSRDKLSSFLSLAEEYNVEWALASFDWGERDDDSTLSRLQRAVNASPWSDN